MVLRLTRQWQPQLSAMILSSVVDSQMMPPSFSEAKAIFFALAFIGYTFHNHFVIFSDSKSVLQAIKNLNWKNPSYLSNFTKT